MANTTTYLALTLPGLGEYVDTWHIPVNENMEKIDAWIMEFGQEIIDARGGTASLAAFLSVAHNADGSLKPTASEAEASSSQVYGYQNPDATPFSLNDRIEAGDREVFAAREGAPSLRAGIALRTSVQSEIRSGSKDGNGYPAWMGFTANKVQVDGSTESLELVIDGYRAAVRNLQEVTLTGGSGLRYISATFQPDGTEVIDGDLRPGAGTGTISDDVNNNSIYLNDITRDFTAENVKAEDVLELFDSASIGKYIIKAVAPGGIVSRLEIKGLFPATVISGINYSIRDPLGVVLAEETAEVSAPGKIYLGEADFDAVAVTAVRARHFKDVFVGEWRAVDVTVTPDFEEIYLHKLGSDELQFSVQVSQANDGSAPVEELDLATLVSTLAVGLTNTLGVSIVNGLVFTAGIFNPGSTNATYTPGSLTGTITGTLTGTITGALTGDVSMDRAIKVKWDKNRIWVKNAGSGVFYADYDGTAHQTGFLRVVVRKRG